MEQQEVLRRKVKAEDIPALYKRAFERELDRVLMAQYSEPGRAGEHRDINKAYARFFSLLATDPQVLSEGEDRQSRFEDRGLDPDDAQTLDRIIRQLGGRLPISAGQIAEDLRSEGINPSEPNMRYTGRVTAAAYRNANIAACEKLGAPLKDPDVWPLPHNLADLGESTDTPSHADGPAPVPTPAPVPDPSASARSSSDSKIGTIAPSLSEFTKKAIAKKIQDGAWHKDRERDVNGAVAIFIAANGDIPVNTMNQHHLIAMKDLFPRLPVVYGRERKNVAGFLVRETIEEALVRGDTLKAQWETDPAAADKANLPYVGLALTTQRKHMTWLNALITHLEGNDPSLAPTGLSFKSVHKMLVQPKKQGDRHAIKGKQKKNSGRLPWDKDELSRMMQTPVWFGCADLWDRFSPGDKIIHDGCYWALPLLVCTLARSDEIAGLAVTDICFDAEVPYINIRENALRRVKTVASTRQVPIASKLMELGFQDYVEAISKAGHRPLFPEFEHDTMGFDKTFYKTLFEPLRKRVFPSGTSRKRGRKDVDVASIRTMGFNILKSHFEETGFSMFDKAHREGLGGHEPGDVESQHYENDFRPKDLVPMVETLASVLPAFPKRPLNLRPADLQKFGKPKGRPRKS